MSQHDTLTQALQQIAMAAEATVCNPAWIAKHARAALATPAQAQQPPYAWAVSGASTMFFGPTAEYDARQEAKHCGGAAEAFPLFKEAQAAQGEPTLRDYAESLVDAGHDFWKACNREVGGGAVRWLSCDDGTLIVFTRCEYRDAIMRNVGGYKAPEVVFAEDGMTASEAQAAQPEPLVRFCPGCGSVGEVPDSFKDCCPDGGHARMIPESLARRCHDLFRLALDSAVEAKAQQAGEPSDEEIAKLHDSMFPAPYDGHANVIKFSRALMAMHATPVPAQPAQGVPDATEEMLVAGLKECEPLGELIDWREGFGRDEMRAVWQAMLTASPTPPAQQPAGDVVRDAERYRWLTSQPIEVPEEGPDLTVWDGNGSGEALRGKDADASIDAAIAASGRKS